MKKLSTEEFIKKCIEVHGNKYDYSKVVFTGVRNKVCIICPEHGEFEQIAAYHLGGHGCPMCGGTKKLTTEEFVRRAKQIHGNKYDYSKVEYINQSTKICITCPEHGEFWQLPSQHLSGNGCSKCAGFCDSTEDFILKAKKIHGDKYDYSKVNYVSMRDKICIICPEHGEFWQYPFDHVNEHGCPKCGVIASKGEDEIYNFIISHLSGDEVIRNDRNILNGKEIDIYIPKLKIGIEYNGLKWHSEEFGKDFKYHLNKSIEANKQGIVLVQIFEDEYLKHKDIVLEKLKHIIGFNSGKEKIMARKTYISKISKNEAKKFLNEYHIQGYGKCTLSYGCFYGDKLIGVMNFLKTNNNTWELVRFATNYHYICSGVGGKLFSYFIKNNKPIMVKTFADRRWTINSDNNLYTKLGFKLNGIVKPDYRYVNIKSPNERIHKANFRKRSIHKKYGLPMNMKEREMTKIIGYEKIWDCGLYRYIWKNETNI